jgi:formylglycine-generating enzyme required for sulfatase activity
MSEQFSNIGNEEQSYQSNAPNESPLEGIKSELHTIVDKLQLDEPPSVQQGRPLWQRFLAWAVPLYLIAFYVVWSYNARVDTCDGAKVKYRENILCIASERDFLLLNETYETEFLARDTSEPKPIDSLNQKKYDDLTETIKSKYADTTAQDVEIRMRLTFLNALRGNGLDSASFCRNWVMGYYNLAVNYLNKGKNDSVCMAYRFLKDWHWKDSVLTKGELAVLEQICEDKKPVTAENLTPFKEKEKYGYKNDKGQVVIRAMYDDAHVFLEDLAAVKVGKLWGFINVYNNMVIPPQFGYAYGFAEGMALISDARNLYGYVNKTGQLVIPPQYEMAERFKQGIARVKLKKADKEWICIDKAGKVVVCVAQSQPKNELKQEKIPPQYKTETEQKTAQNAQTGAENDPKAQQRITPIESITTKVGNVSFEMVKVAGGTFKMGSDDKEAGNSEKPVHSVTLSDFYIGKYEVTQKQWRDVMGSDPPELNFKGCDNCPVESVSWDDIQEFLKKLNSQSKTQFRLPTEAEWEFAARGGNASRGFKYSGSENLYEVAWYGDNSKNKTQPVGTKKANELGIFDMSGNVWEWCSDWYDENYYKNSPAQNPKGAASSLSRVLRGGSWVTDGQFCRSSIRFNDGAPESRFSYYGFRLVFVP